MTQYIANGIMSLLCIGLGVIIWRDARWLYEYIFHQRTE